MHRLLDGDSFLESSPWIECVGGAASLGMGEGAGAEGVKGFLLGTSSALGFFVFFLLVLTCLSRPPPP